MKICLLSLFITYALFTAASNAQTSMTDTTFTGNFLETNLFNDINLANLKSLANYNGNVRKFKISLSNMFLSNVSKLEQNFYRDYNNFKFILTYETFNNFRSGIGFQNVFFTDDKNVETNKNNSSFYFSDFEYKLRNNVSINSRLGLKTEDQIGEFNSGFSGLINLNASNYFIEDYMTNGNMTAFYENLIQKQNHNYELSANLFKRFTSYADNNGFIRFYDMRNDFYYPATASISNIYGVRNNIERRYEKYFSVGDLLNYRFSRNLYFSFNGSYMNRIITKEYKYKSSPIDILLENVYDTKINEAFLELSGTLNFSFSKINSRFKMMYNERSENHIPVNTGNYNQSQISALENNEKNKNNNSRRASLILDLEYLLSNINSFGFTGTASSLRYDTDFDENYDDRDEFESIISAYHIFNNLRNFNIETRFEVIISKLSYIFSQRSANNYKNRIFRLSSGSSFKPVKNFSTKNLLQVLANYTVYDFEDIISQVQSFSYRQLSVWDSSSYKFTKLLTLNLRGELKFYEQGQFNNSEFSVKPIAYFEEMFFQPELYFFVNNISDAGIGYKYYHQKRFQYDSGDKNLLNKFMTLGPVGEINFYFNKNSIINLTGGYDFIQYTNPVRKESSAHLQFRILWNM